MAPLLPVTQSETQCVIPKAHVFYQRAEQSSEDLLRCTRDPSLRLKNGLAQDDAWIQLRPNLKLQDCPNNHRGHEVALKNQDLFHFVLLCVLCGFVSLETTSPATPHLPLRSVASDGADA